MTDGTTLFQEALADAEAQNWNGTIEKIGRILADTKLREPFDESSTTRNLQVILGVAYVASPLQPDTARQYARQMFEQANVSSPTDIASLSMAEDTDSAVDIYDFAYPEKAGQTATEGQDSSHEDA